MKEKNWKDCIFTQSVKSVSLDILRAKSLHETAYARIDAIEKITEKNCNFVFEDYYTSLIEVLQAICFSKGYNVLNHICLGFYIKDVLQKNELYTIFDDLRCKRNSLTYYGKRMDYEVAKEAISQSKYLLSELEKYI
jgi:hypothetical protein